jgi:hypothetical protein
MKKYNLLFLLVSGLIFNSCSSDSSGGGTGTLANTNDFNEGYVQIERLARPAINEGLVITNDYLNAFNSIPPTSDLSSAASAVLAEATAVLDVVTGLVGGGPTSAQVASQFLPDVMRIDTANANASVGAGTTDANVGYISCVNGTGSGPLLCGGRKPQDDVIDITLNYIASGVPTQPYTISDGISYSTAHSALPTAFPYLAVPK